MSSDIKVHFAQKTNGKKTELNTLLQTIRNKRKEIKKRITLSFDYQHLCATISADSNWDNEYISSVVNWGMGEGSDNISAIITDDPGKFGLADKNSDSLADSLKTTEDSATSFMYLLSKEGTDEESVSKVLQWMQMNQSKYE